MLTTTHQLCAQSYIDHVERVHNFMLKQSDFSPRNHALTATLYGFVRDTMKKRDPEEVDAILATPCVQAIAPSLRRLLGRAEYEMECFCANAMIGNERGVEGRFASYGNFIYRGNYEALVAAEIDAIKWNTKAPPIKANCESVAFIGAGPLPISAIMFHLRTGLQVTCIDNDEKACRLGRQLILHLTATEPGYKDLDKAIHFVHKPGQEHDYATHPIVFIASLVERKDTVVSQIIRTSHTVATTIIRSAEGLSTLLYNPEHCVAGKEFYNFYLAGQTVPTSQAINTSLVYKFPSGKCMARNKIDDDSLPTRDTDNIKLMSRRMWRTQPDATPI